MFLSFFKKLGCLNYMFIITTKLLSTWCTKENKQLFQLSLYIFLQYTYIESHTNLYAFVLITQRKYKHRCLERPVPGPQNAKAFFHHKCWRSGLSFMEKQETYKQGLLQEWLWCIMGWQVEAILSYCLNSKPTLSYSALGYWPQDSADHSSFACCSVSGSFNRGCSREKEKQEKIGTCPPIPVNVMLKTQLPASKQQLTPVCSFSSMGSFSLRSTSTSGWHSLLWELGSTSRTPPPSSETSTWA